MPALTNAGLNIAPFKRASLNSLRVLLDEQRDEWLERLHWDYSEASSLLRDVIRRGELPGFLVEAQGSPVGFAFYVAEESRCSIGDVYVSRKWRGAGADASLVETIMEKVRERPRLFRVECQSVSFGNTGADAFFCANGFHRFDRNFMIADLNDDASLQSDRAGSMSDRFFIRTWDDSHFSSVARTIYRSYRGEDDSKINSLYATEEGCGELLSILTETIWCGSFQPEVSKVAVDREGVSIVGAAIVSRIAPRVGHIGQVSVLPEHQGFGIGRALITEVISELQRMGYSRSSLAVTTTNERASRLYNKCGFKTVHSFPVYYSDQYK